MNESYEIIISQYERLTDKEKQQMREAYERLKGTDLPRKISFGHVKDSENNV